MTAIDNSENKVALIAKVGLVTKGVVYCLLGVLAFMAAFNINGQSTNDTDKRGVLDFLDKQTGGQVLLGIVALGLACYTIWRIIQFVRVLKGDDENNKKSKKVVKGIRYIFSAIGYGLLAASVVKKLISSTSGSDNNKQDAAQKLMEQPLGQWLVGIVALIFLGVGIYQVYYGYSEKYKKHVDKSTSGKSRKAMLTAGKIGYMARGIVWAIIALLFGKAALNANASETGGTSKALSFISDAPYGPYLLGAVGLGLVCYGVFNFVRAKYENLG